MRADTNSLPNRGNLNVLVFKDFVNYSYMTSCNLRNPFSRSLEISASVSSLNWVIWVAWREFKQIVYLKKGA